MVNSRKDHQITMCSSSNDCPRVVGSLCSILIVCVYPGQGNHRGHCELSPYERGWDAKPYLLFKPDVWTGACNTGRYSGLVACFRSRPVWGSVQVSHGRRLLTTDVMVIAIVVLKLLEEGYYYIGGRTIVATCCSVMGASNWEETS